MPVYKKRSNSQKILPRVLFGVLLLIGLPLSYFLATANVGTTNQNSKASEEGIYILRPSQLQPGFLPPTADTSSNGSVTKDTLGNTIITNCSFDPLNHNICHTLTLTLPQQNGMKFSEWTISATFTGGVEREEKNILCTANTNQPFGKNNQIVAASGTRQSATIHITNTYIINTNQIAEPTYYLTCEGDWGDPLTHGGGNILYSSPPIQF